MTDKYVEIDRYDARAIEAFNNGSYVFSNNSPRYSRVGECEYRDMLSNIAVGSKVLEIGAGMGENTECLLGVGLTVCATDISSDSVRLLKKRFDWSKGFTAQVADMEALPFPDESFDVVCSAGALSYGDNHTVREEIYRVLKQGGSFIAFDSLNHNPIYKLNRYVHYLRGHRTRSTLHRMPTQQLIDCYASRFGSSEVQYFGAFVWSSALFKWIISEEKILNLIHFADSVIRVKKSAFKFTMKVVKS